MDADFPPLISHCVKLGWNSMSVQSLLFIYFLLLLKRHFIHMQHFYFLQSLCGLRNSSMKKGIFVKIIFNLSNSIGENFYCTALTQIAQLTEHNWIMYTLNFYFCSCCFLKFSVSFVVLINNSWLTIPCIPFY